MKEAASPRTWRPEWVAALLIAIGFGFRLWASGHARFTGDESYFWSTARAIATFKLAPVYGPALTGAKAFHPGPIFYYLMAIPQLLGSSPKLGAALIAALHAGAAALLYKLCVRAASARAGLIACALLMFAPWDVLYADRIWLSCMAPVWGMATIYAALSAPKDPRWWGPLAFLAAVCPQLHMSAPIVWAAVFFYLLLTAGPIRTWPRRPIAWGLALAFLIYLGPLIWEIRHGFTNTIAILTKGTGDLSLRDALANPVESLMYTVLFSSSEVGYHFARGYWFRFEPLDYYFTSAGAARYLSAHGPWAIANLLSISASFMAWGYAATRLRAAFKRRTFELADHLNLILAVGLLAAGALLVISRKQYFPHYTNLFMPLALWPLIQFLDRMFDSPARPLAGLLLVGIVTAMASSSIRYYRTVDGLNGLDASEGMVQAILKKDRGPVQLHFEGFDNTYAWQVLARGRFSKDLVVEQNARVRYDVKNAAPSLKSPGKGARRFGAVVLQRSVP